MKTTAVRTQDIEQKWYIMDCSGKTLGRLSVQVANILRGKNKPEYTPNADVGDFVVLVNAKDQLLVEEELMDISQLREGTKAFLDNWGKDPNLSAIKPPMGGEITCATPKARVAAENAGP